MIEEKSSDNYLIELYPDGWLNVFNVTMLMDIPNIRDKYNDFHYHKKRFDVKDDKSVFYDNQRHLMIKANSIKEAIDIFYDKIVKEDKIREYRHQTRIE